MLAPRAREPDSSGHVAGLYYELFGGGAPTVLLLPTWSIIHSRHWRMQVPFLARSHRVLTFDGRGNGRSDRPPGGYEIAGFAADALTVMDATATEQATLVSLSMGAQWALTLAAEHPERVTGAVFISPSLPIGEPLDWPASEGWYRYDPEYWRRDYRGFLEFFFARVFPEPHSTKPIEDCVGWGLETTAETLIATELGPPLEEAAARMMCRRVRCPALVIAGTADAVTGPDRGIALAEALGADLVLLDGCGHAPHVRDPVRVNLLLRAFLSRTGAQRRSV
jgi:pimeloyl-ACP methyl ester carboxylesterase